MSGYSSYYNLPPKGVPPPYSSTIGGNAPSSPSLSNTISSGNNGFITTSMLGTAPTNNNNNNNNNSNTVNANIVTSPLSSPMIAPTNSQIFFTNVKEFINILNIQLSSSSYHNWPILLGRIFGSDPKSVIRICAESEVKDLLGNLSSSSDCFKFMVAHFSNTLNQYNFPRERIPKLLLYSLYSKQDTNTSTVVDDCCVMDLKNGSVMLNIFQLYFFAFGLFGDYLSTTMTSTITSSAVGNTRTVMGVPSFSYKGGLSSSGAGIPTLQQQQQQLSSTERQKSIYIALLKDYLNYFLPRNPTTEYDQTQSICFLKILCYCFLGHNLTNQQISKSSIYFKQNQNQKFMEYTKPSLFYTEISTLLLSHIQEFIKIQTSVTSIEQNTNQIIFYNQIQDLFRYPLFKFMISFFEKYDRNDPNIPIESVIRLWTNFLTPWRQQVQSTKNSSLFSSFSLPLHSTEPEAISENYIIENYYQYSFIFSMFILRALLSFDFSNSSQVRSFQRVLNLFMNPRILKVLQYVDRHDKVLQQHRTIPLLDPQINPEMEGVSADIIIKLELQATQYGIRESLERFSMFSHIMNNNVSKLMKELSKRSANINQKTREFIYNKLSTIYDIQPITELNDPLRPSNQSLSATTASGLSNSPNRGLTKRSLLASLSPVRGTDGRLTDEGRRQLLEGTRKCTVYDVYPNTLGERYPITSDELGIPIKLVYMFTDDPNIRIWSRKIFRKDICLRAFVVLFIVYLFIKFIQLLIYIADV